MEGYGDAYLNRLLKRGGYLVGEKIFYAEDNTDYIDIRKLFKYDSRSQYTETIEDDCTNRNRYWCAMNDWLGRAKNLNKYTCLTTSEFKKRRPQECFCLDCKINTCLTEEKYDADNYCLSQSDKQAIEKHLHTEIANKIKQADKKGNSKSHQADIIQQIIKNIRKEILHKNEYDGVINNPVRGMQSSLCLIRFKDIDIYKNEVKLKIQKRELACIEGKGSCDGIAASRYAQGDAFWGPGHFEKKEISITEKEIDRAKKFTKKSHLGNSLRAKLCISRNNGNLN